VRPIPRDRCRLIRVSRRGGKRPRNRRGAEALPGEHVLSHTGMKVSGDAWLESHLRPLGAGAGRVGSSDPGRGKSCLGGFEGVSLIRRQSGPTVPDMLWKCQRIRHKPTRTEAARRPGKFAGTSVDVGPSSKGRPQRGAYRVDTSHPAPQQETPHAASQAVLDLLASGAEPLRPGLHPAFGQAFTRPGYRRFVGWITALALYVEEHTITQSAVAIERIGDRQALESFAEYRVWWADHVTRSLARLRGGSRPDRPRYVPPERLSRRFPPRRTRGARR
jgi:hypothetical protein